MNPENSIIKFECPSCSQPLEGVAELEFQEVTCPACQQAFFPKPRMTYSTEKPPAPAPSIPPAQTAPATKSASASSLTKCPSCNSDISVHAAACPKCGHQFKYAGRVNLKDPVHLLGLGICALIILSIIYYSFSISSGQSAAQAQEEERSKELQKSTHDAFKSSQELDEELHPKK